MNNNMYVFNEDGVAEWAIASSLDDAIDCIKQHWGESTWENTLDSYRKDGISEDDLIATVVRQEGDNAKFALIDDEGDTVTLTVREHIERAEKKVNFVSPMYFACENY